MYYPTYQFKIDIFESIIETFNEIHYFILFFSYFKSSLDDLIKAVFDLNFQIDIETYNEQFHILCWIFQHNPEYAKAFTAQFNTFNKQVEDEDPEEGYLGDSTENGDYYDEENENGDEEYDENANDISNTDKSSEKFEPITPPQPLPSTSLNPKLNSTTNSAADYLTPQTQSLTNSFLAKENPNKTNQYATPNIYLQKPIGDIKFPKNLDITNQLKNSAEKFNEELNKSDNYQDYDENEEDNQEEDEGADEFDKENEQVISGNLNNTKQDTFLSCDDNNNQSRLENSSYYQANDTNNSSVKDLEILFEQNGVYYEYDETKNIWKLIGNSNISIIGDEISQKSES